MKNPLPLLVLLAALAVGCGSDSSSDTQVVTPNGGTPKEGSMSSGTQNPNIPDNVKNAIPPTGKPAGK